MQADVNRRINAQVFQRFAVVVLRFQLFGQVISEVRRIVSVYCAPAAGPEAESNAQAFLLQMVAAADRDAVRRLAGPALPVAPNDVRQAGQRRQSGETS